MLFLKFLKWEPFGCRQNLPDKVPSFPFFSLPLPRWRSDLSPVREVRGEDKWERHSPFSPQPIRAGLGENAARLLGGLLFCWTLGGRDEFYICCWLCNIQLKRCLSAGRRSGILAVGQTALPLYARVRPGDSHLRCWLLQL